VLGRVEFRLGRFDEASGWWRGGLALARRTGLHGYRAACVVGLGDIELARGNPIAAQRLYQQCLPPPGQASPTGLRPAADLSPTQAALIGLGRVALACDHPAEARSTFGQILESPVRRASTVAEAIAGLGQAALQQGQLSEPAELCGLLLAWPGTPFHVRQAAEQLLDRLRHRLPAEALASALALGRAQSPEAVRACIAAA
jgi:hypothetical protein